jgi:hypothetical protein
VRFGGNANWLQEVPQFIMTSAKASRGVNGTEATHWPTSALDPSMILLKAVDQA